MLGIEYLRKTTGKVQTDIKNKNMVPPFKMKPSEREKKILLLEVSGWRGEKPTSQQQESMKVIGLVLFCSCVQTFTTYFLFIAKERIL